MKHLETGTGPLVSDLVPLTHAGLRISRVFFPFEDAMGEEISWTAFVPADRGFSAGTTWHELLEDAGREPEHYRAANGVLDEKTAAGLRELIGDLRLTALYWPGYWNVWPGMQAQGIKPDYTARTPNNEVEEFISRSITAADIQAGLRVPEFAWDDDGTLAWGAQLYPDSLVVAVAPELLARLYGTGHLTATGVRGDEIMPPSAGD